MRICVVGTGYVGLVSGACLADFGMQVVGVDKDVDKIEALRRCEIPIYEPGLATLVRKNMAEGRLRFTTDLGPAIEDSQAIFIAVGTPSLPDGVIAEAWNSFGGAVATETGLHFAGDFEVVLPDSAQNSHIGA